MTRISFYASLDARMWDQGKIQRYILRRLCMQSQYAQRDQAKYKQYLGPTRFIPNVHENNGNKGF